MQYNINVISACWTADVLLREWKPERTCSVLLGQRLWPVDVHGPAPRVHQLLWGFFFFAAMWGGGISDQVFGVMSDGGVACARWGYSHQAFWGKIPASGLEMRSMLWALEQLAPVLTCDATHRLQPGVGLVRWKRQILFLGESRFYRFMQEPLVWFPLRILMQIAEPHQGLAVWTIYLQHQANI